MRLFALWMIGLAAHAAGFDATIRRDQYGVPHISGRRDADVVFGLAYAMAEDNFWQLEEDYLRKLGRAAEIHGKAQLANDIEFRLYEVEKRSKEQYATATPYLRSICDAFAAGYNHYLARHAEVKPRLLAKLEPWHVLAFQDPSPGLSGSGVRIEDARREFPVLAGVREAEAPNDDEGSNMWAVSPKKSASGNALLFLNPHVGFFGGGQRYEVHLTSKEGLDVSGFAILGTPYIRSGFDGRHGWCHTNNYADITDVWKEQFDANNPLEYAYDGGKRKAESWTEEIAVRNGERLEKVRVTMRRTHHGPVVGQRDGVALAKQSAPVTALELMTQRIAMAKARTLEEFQAAMRRRAITGSNTIYADARGNIYYIHGNAIPKRDARFNWLEPVDGSTRATEWQGLHAFEELIQFTNPASGYLQNCNSTPVHAAGEVASPPAHPAYFLPEPDTTRAKRSRQILEGQEKFSFADWSRAALDTGIYLAKPEIAALRAQMDKVTAEQPARAAAVKPLVDALQAWDGVSRNDSLAATLFVGAYLLRPSRAQATGFLTVETLEKLKADLEKDHGTWRVAWGEINRLQRVHSSGTEEPNADSKPSLPVPGTPGQVGIVFVYNATQPKGEKRMYGRSGNSYIAVVEFGKKLKAGSLLVFGQNADPKSPHFFDQGKLYSEQKFKPVPYAAAEVKKVTQSVEKIRTR